MSLRKDEGSTDVSELPRRVLIDCTHTYHYGLRTGVQRVVRNLVREAQKLGSHLHCEPVFLQDGKFLPYDPNQKSDQQPLSQQMRDNVLDFAPKFYRKFAKTLCKLVPHRKVKSWLMPEPGHLGIFRKMVRKQEKLERLERASNTDWRQPGEGDILLLPDAYWCLMNVWPVVEQAREQGAFATVVLYDLIPVTHPQFVPAGSDTLFLKYLRKAVEHSDLLVAISDTVRDECREKIPELLPDIETHQNISSFRLGAELDAVQGTVSEAVQDLFDPRNPETPYVMVSTFDPRKNHPYLLDAFEQFWESHPEAILCLIGGRGWMSEETLARIENHPRYGKQLLTFHSLPDVDLQYCYRNARGVICPSMVEGFGLPIVEALAYGRKTFVNDTPIHREVGRQDVSYFDGKDPSSLSELLVTWEVALSRGAPLAQQVRQPTTWRESTQSILEQCIEAYVASRSEETTSTSFTDKKMVA